MSHEKKSEEILRLKLLIQARAAAVKEANKLNGEVREALLSIHDNKTWLLDGHDSLNEFLNSLKPGISKSYFFKQLDKARKSGGVK